VIGELFPIKQADKFFFYLDGLGSLASSHSELMQTLFYILISSHVWVILDS
jgi:hypothetical protein